MRPYFASRVRTRPRLSLGPKFWVITEADRSATTILMPEGCIFARCNK